MPDNRRFDDELTRKQSKGGGARVVAMLGGCLFLLLAIVTAFFNQTGGALPGQAATSDVSLDIFEEPRPDITVKKPSAQDPAWIRHGQPFNEPTTTPVLALVLLDDGVESEKAMAALDWGVPITIAVAADFDTSPYRVQQIRQSGGEVLALLPFGYGPALGESPNVLRHGLAKVELRRRLMWHLGRAGSGIVGAIDHRAGTNRLDDAFLQTMAGVLLQEDLLMVDAGEPADTLLAARLRHGGVPVGRRTVRIDRTDIPDTILDALISAERHAYAWGTAIVLVEAGEVPMAVIRDWLARRGEGVSLAPVSHVIRRLRIGSARQAAE